MMSWSLVDKSLVLQSVLYFAIVASGLATIISTVVSRNGFGGLCVLYGESNCHHSNETPIIITTTVIPPHSSPQIPTPTTTSPATSNTTLAPPLAVSEVSTTTSPTTYTATKLPTASTTANTLKPAHEKILIEAVGGKVSVCDFVVGANVVVCFLYALANACYHAYCARKSAYQIRVGYQMWTRTLTFSTFLAFILVMSSACMITVGLSMWCRSTLAAFKDCQLDIHRCSDSQYTGNTWQWISGDHNDNNINDENENNHSGNSNGSSSNKSSSSSSSSSSSGGGGSILTMDHYHDLLEVAETSCWMNVAFFLVHLVLYIHRLFKQRHVQTSYQEPFTTDFLDAFT